MPRIIYGTSNILNLEIGIFKEIKHIPPKHITTTQYRGYGNNTPYTGGACVEGEGHSEYVSTVDASNSTFVPQYRFPVTIQLVNNENNEQRLTDSRKHYELDSIRKQNEISVLQTKIEVHRKSILHIERTISELRQTPKEYNVLFQKDEQNKFLI